jgi:Zn-dependent peptidase ImmA (M78 family)
MTTEHDDKIIKSRRLLENPYAYLDDFGRFSAAVPGKPTPAVADAPFPTHLTGRYLSHTRKTSGRRRRDDADIEQVTIALQRQIWADRNLIWPAATPSDPIDILNPGIALSLIGYDYDLVETLGQYHANGRQVEVAGMIDDSVMEVRISRQFQYDIRSFTTAHELGHAMLHDACGLHRDRPLDGTKLSRNNVEYEADKFASYFLMPAKLLKERFQSLFHTDAFFLNEETIFALSRGNSLDLERDCNTLRDLSRILASVENYNGSRFISLAKQFRVSPEAMAIRLEELELVSI